MLKKHILTIFLLAILISMAGCATQDLSGEAKKAVGKSGGALWTAGTNKFTNMPERELEGYLGLRLTENDLARLETLKDSGTPGERLDESLPEHFDWRDVHGGKNFVSSIKDQGPCGSCWAFASVATLESSIKTHFNNPSIEEDLSEQDLVSCFHGFGCFGLMSNQFDLMYGYIYNTGICTESCFPYSASNEPCANKCSDWEDYKFSSSYWNLNELLVGGVEQRREYIKQSLIHFGPLVTGMLVYDDFPDYESGIYSHTVPIELGYHAVTIIGWGQEAGLDYWIVKNSWGEDWGENGTFRIEMGDSRIDSILLYALKEPVLPYEESVICEDDDEDGFCYWGLGEKPLTCPSSCTGNDRFDCDDSNPSILDDSCGQDPSFGFLTIIVEQEDANLFINDEFIDGFDSSKPTEYLLPAGTYNIRVSKTCYDYYETTIEVIQGFDEELHIDLESNYTNNYITVGYTGADYDNLPDAFNSAGCGDSIFIQDGAYDVNLTLPIDNLADILIQGESKENTVINFIEEYNNTYTAKSLFSIIASDNINMKDLTFNNEPIISNEEEKQLGCFLGLPHSNSVPSKNILLENVRVNDFYQVLFAIGGGSLEDFTIKNSELINNYNMIEDRDYSTTKFYGTLIIENSEISLDGTFPSWWNWRVSSSPQWTLFYLDVGQERNNIPYFENVVIKNNTFSLISPPYDSQPLDFTMIEISARADPIPTSVVLEENNIFSDFSGSIHHVSEVFSLRTIDAALTNPFVLKNNKIRGEYEYIAEILGADAWVGGNPQVYINGMDYGNSNGGGFDDVRVLEYDYEIRSGGNLYGIDYRYVTIENSTLLGNWPSHPEDLFYVVDYGDFPIEWDINHNYYPSYTGIDSDEDGIGDTPMIIYDQDGNYLTEDEHPLMCPPGEFCGCEANSTVCGEIFSPDCNGIGQSVCCGDDAGENFQVMKFSEVNSDLYSEACCDSQYDCVLDGVCYETEETATGISNDGYDQTVFCLMQHWTDCDDHGFFCRYCDVGADLPNCEGNDCFMQHGEEEPTGDLYFTQPNGYDYVCCGDDPDEYPKSNGDLTRCCNHPTDTLDAAGNCIPKGKTKLISEVPDPI